MNLHISSFVVRSEDGSLDLDETLSKFSAVVKTWEATQKADQETVLAHINKFYDEMPGVAVSMSVLYSYVAGKMNAYTSDAFNTVKERCDDTVKSNPNIFTQERRTGTYRTADRKPKTENKAA